VRNIGNIKLGKKQAIVDALPAGEECLAVVQPNRWMGDGNWAFPLVLLTNQRVIVSKDKLIGKPATEEVSLLGVDSSGSGPVSSFGTWGFKFATREEKEYGLIFAEDREGLAFEEVFRDAVDSAQARAIELLERLNPST
jgi:hypothetical protein